MMERIDSSDGLQHLTIKYVGFKLMLVWSLL